LLQIYREKANQRMMNGISQNVIDPTQNIGEGIVEDTTGESIAQFAAAVHSNPEKAEQRQKVTLLVGKGIQQQDLMVRQNIAEPSDTEGKAIDQFAKTIHSNPETVRQALYIEEHATPKRIETVKKGLFLQVYIFFCETIETLRESKDTFTIH